MQCPDVISLARRQCDGTGLLPRELVPLARAGIADYLSYLSLIGRIGIAAQPQFAVIITCNPESIAARLRRRKKSVNTCTIVISPVNRSFEARYLLPYVGRIGIERMTGKVSNIVAADTSPDLTGNSTHGLTCCKTPNLTSDDPGFGIFFCLDNTTTAKRRRRRWRRSIRHLINSPEVLCVLCHHWNIKSFFLASQILRPICSRISDGIPVRTKINIVISRGQSRLPGQRRTVRRIHFCIIRAWIFRAPTAYEGKNRI